MTNELPDFLIIPSVLIEDKDLQPLDGYVYGIVYWYTKLKLQKCIASNKTIADLLNSHPLSVSRSVSNLEKKNYITVIIDRAAGNKREIIPNINFGASDAKLAPTYKQNSIEGINQMATPSKPNGEQNNIDLITEDNNINIYTPILDYWNSKKIIVHRALTDKIKRAINGRIKDKYTPSEITRSIDNYEFILRSPDYFWNYEWTLVDFLHRGFEKFLDLEIAKKNYKKGGFNNGGYESPNRAQKGKYSNIPYEGGE